MNVILSRIYLVLLLFASLSLFFLTPTASNYAIQSFNAADIAYHFYDDFPTQVEKPLFLFKCLLCASLLLMFKTSGQQRFQYYHGLKVSLYLTGGALILIWWSTALMVVAFLFVVSYPWGQSEISYRQRGWILAAIFVIALIFRVEKIPNVMNQPLQPDSLEFVLIAQNSTYYYDTGHREPLWAWVNMGISLIFQVPPNLEQGYLPIRVISILLSCFCAIAAYEFGRRWISHQAGFFAAMFIALNKAFIYRSLQGLREESLILLLFAFLWCAWMPSTTNNILSRKTVLLGVSGALLLLLRTSCLPIVIFSLLWTTWSRNYTIRQVLMAAVICFIPIMPYYIYCWVHFGDPLFSGNSHIHFYYNALFGEYPEGRITPFQFMFKIFTWYESIIYTLIGIADTFLGRYALRLFYFPASVLFIGASAVGYILWILKPDRRIFIVSMLLILGPMAFFMGIMVKSAVVFDWRLVVHLFPFMAYATMEGLHFLLQQARWLPKLWMDR